MPDRVAFDYAIVRVVPLVEREEFVNAGVILFCPSRDFLEARVALDDARLLALCPGADLPEVQEALANVVSVARGGPGSGPVGQLSLRERWHWLVSPRSTVVQTSAPHAGLCESPEAFLEHLLRRVVDSPKPAP